MELEQRQPARRWARTLGEMREELGMPATPLGASAMLAEFDGDVEATPLIKALQKHVAGRPHLLPRQKPIKPAPKAYSTPVVGGADAALDLLRREHNDALRQMAGLQERAAKHEEQMLDQERRHAKLLVEERARLKQQYDDKVRADLTACRELQRRLQSAPAATIADMDEQMRRREKIAANKVKRAETLWNTERATLQQQLEAQKSKHASEVRRMEKIDKKTEARLATALANVKSLKLELAEEQETVKSMKLELEKERADRAALEANARSLEEKSAPTKAPPSPTATSPAWGDESSRPLSAADRNTNEADETASVNLSNSNDQIFTKTTDVYGALLRSQSKLQATSAELAVCRKSLRHEQAAAARDRLNLAAFEAKRAKEIAKQRCSHCGQRAAVHPDDHHGPVALADPARGGSPAHLGKMAVGQWRGRDRVEMQKLCLQVLGAARLAVGMPAVDPQLAETMSAMQQTWASAMQGEIEPKATLLLRSKSSGESAPGSSEVPFGYRTDANNEEHAAAARIQGLVRGKKERRRQRELNTDLAVEGQHGTDGSERVELLSHLVSSLSERPCSSSNPRKAGLANGEAEFDAKFKLRSATRSIAMAIAASARLVAGPKSGVCADAEQRPEVLPEVVEAVQDVVDNVCAKNNEALGGYVVRIVGAQGLAPLTSSSNDELSDGLTAFLPPPDVNAFAVVYVNGVWAGETNVALQTVAPLWNADILLRGAAMLHGSSPPSGARPNSIAVALFDYERKGKHAFLGQVELNAAEQGDPCAGLPTQDAAEMPLRPHPTHPKARVRGSVLLRVCPVEEPQATLERKFTRKRSATSSAPVGGWSDQLMILANGTQQDESSFVTEAEKEWMDVRAAANAGGLAMRRWWSHTIDDEPGSKWLYDLVLLGADVDMGVIYHGAQDDDGVGCILPSEVESSYTPDLYVECHLNGELLGHSSLISGSASPRWMPPQTIPLRSLQIQHGATNQLVLILCDYRRPGGPSEQDDSNGLGVVGSVDLRGIGAAALPTTPTCMPLTTKLSTGSTIQVGTVEVCTGRRRRDVNQRAAEAEWTDSQLDAAVKSVRLSARLRRQRVALAQALTTVQAAGRQAAAAEARADDAEAATAAISHRLQKLTAARERDEEQRKELRQQLATIDKTQEETVAKAVADAVHDVQTGASHARELEVRLEQAHRETAAFRARCQKLAAELSQLKIDHATALVSGVNQRDGDGWQMNDGPKRSSRFCAVM